MSVFSSFAAQISAGSPDWRKSQFRACRIGSPFQFVSCKGLCAKQREASIKPGTGGWMPQPGRSLATILVALVLCGAFRCEAAEPSEETIARGQALVVAGDCASCHTADPAKPFAGGKRIATPFGGVYTTNLTPDRETGIGTWRDEDFVRALRLGVAPDGSRYYPAFPYPYFTKLTRDDILAIRAYLGTLDPVRKATPPPELLFPFNFRVGMRLWNWLYLQPGIIMPD